MHGSLEKIWSRRFSSTSVQGAHNVSLPNNQTLKILSKNKQDLFTNHIYEIYMNKANERKEQMKDQASWKRREQ